MQRRLRVGHPRFVGESRRIILGLMVLCAAGVSAAEPSNPVYRFWNPALGSYFYTLSDAEADALILSESSGWQFQGVAWQGFAAQSAAVEPVRRFWRDDLQRFSFTADADEIAARSEPGSPWQDQGIAWYSPPVPVGQSGQAEVPVFRFWSETLQAEFFTASADEIAVIFAELPQWAFEFAVWGAPGPAAHSRRVLSFTDVHFDPFAEAELLGDLAEMPGESWDAFLARRAADEWPAPGGSANYALLTDMLANARLRVPAPDFVLYAGDFLAHGFEEQFAAAFPQADEEAYRDFVMKTLTFFTAKVSAVFPGVPVFFTLGNNDAFAGDYQLIDGGAFLQRTAELFLTSWLNAVAEPAEFLATYSAHGNYSLRLPTLEKTRLIALNSVFFSPRHQGDDLDATLRDQLDWFEGELARASAAGERVWLLTHIPPSVDVFATLHSSPPQVTSQWRAEPLERFLDLMHAYAPIVVFGQSGHTHMDDFRLISHTDAGYFPDEPPELIKITPSVTPYFGNNPAFQVYGYAADTADVTEIDTYYLDLDRADRPDWVRHEYDFASAYGLTPDARGFDQLYLSLPDDQERRDQYLLFYGSSIDPSGIASDWRAYWCGIGALTIAEYQQQCPEVIAE